MPLRDFLLASIGFRDLVVAERQALSKRFVHLTMTGAGGATFTPGDKIQLRVPDGVMRTYTPFAFDPTTGSFELLTYLHGDEPGSRWAREVSEGAKIFGFGPRRSLDIAGPAPIVLFGDETSFAVARALQDAGTPLAAVFEVEDRDESAAVLASLAVSQPTLLARTPTGEHLGAVRDRLASLAQADARLVLTGKAQSIQAVRSMLRAQPLPFAAQKTKAYWSVGKRGLD